MKYYILLVATCLASSILHAEETKFTQLSLPHGVQIKVPKNWWILSGDLNTSIETAGEAALKLSGLKIPLHKETLLFRANSMPRTTYANISITASDAEFTSEELGKTTPQEIQAATPIMKEVVAKTIAPGGFVLGDFEPVKLIKVDGNYGMAMTYQRSGPKGSVVVKILRMVVSNIEITIQMSYRKSEAALWNPVLDYMRTSITIKNESGSVTPNHILPAEQESNLPDSESDQ
jgi:hypothetical protein